MSAANHSTTATSLLAIIAGARNEEEIVSLLDLNGITWSGGNGRITIVGTSLTIQLASGEGWIETGSEDIDFELGF